MNTTFSKSAKFIVFLGLTASAALGLSACVPLLVAGAATSGAMIAFDRRSFGAQTEDQAIEMKGQSRLPEAVARAGGVSVTSFNRKVLLTGQVADEKAKLESEAAMAKMESVASVHNELSIGSKVALGTSTSDTTITGRVRASLLEARDLQSNAFKVVTETGVVYLMGLVTQREGDRAAQIAARVPGATRVVTVYQYLSEDDLGRVERRASR